MSPIVALRKMKWKQRVAVALVVGVVLLTSLLVLDVRLAQLRGQRPADPAESPLIRHGDSRRGQGAHFQRQFLGPQQHNYNESTDALTANNNVNEDVHR